MKKEILMLTLLGIMSPGIKAQDLTGPEIIGKVNDLMNQKTIYSKSTMTIVTSSGAERTFESESWSKDYGEKNLIKYTAPTRVRGQATLMLNHADDIWVFFPKTQRTRKLATHAKKQKMEGSDFSYEDMGSGNSFVEDYTAKLIGEEKKEGHDCYKVELTRKENSNLSYSRLIMWVVKENFVPLVIDYYDENDPGYLLKTLIQSDIKTIDNIPTPMKLVMRNRSDNTSTRMELIEVKYNIPLEDQMFTERGMK